MSRTAIRAKMHKAQAATKAMDDLVLDKLRDLTRAMNDGNGAAIYHDHHQVACLLSDVGVAIRKAQEVYRATDWPTADDYDNE